MTSRVARIVLTACLSSGLVCSLSGADWRQFRGNDSSSVAAGERPPVVWGETENIAWKIPLTGRGLSGPIIVGDRVYLTSSDGFHQQRLAVECFDTKTGVRRWRRTFLATGRTQCHPKMAVATPTPASDGKRIFAFYSSNDLVCLDLDGNLLWFRGLTHDFPNASNSLGMASSPVVVGKTLVVQVENHADSFAAGFDVETGRTLWKKNQTRSDNWTSPVVLKGKTPAGDLVLLQNSTGLTAVHPRTGKSAWSFDKPTKWTPSVAIADGTIFIPADGLTALKPVVGGGSPTVLWQQSRLGPSTPSPLVYRGRIYVMANNILRCGDTATGKLLWQLRLPGAYTSSPVAADGHLYYFNEKGVAQVIDVTGAKGKIFAQNEVGDTILCTPAIANDALFVRSHKHLWKIGR